ncbi:phosphatidylglycerophosphatase SCDLUD_004707 [Saccharomycodes ludwigii]|uniref:phosphatidylglycerophosphatase n=1 Tax=Saccharomycodes ludwigii TaxID=36035 RepID=UPI001E8C7DDB|nr:hypothetical protein SCDLUD_004707 [Saccharomycodes ludwigii]KAH3899271.1 hypothetical protein SCDLUD_004707 [Saccharomycodes ludwigii]
MTNSLLNYFNLNAILNIYKIVLNPKLCLPTITINNFGELPIAHLKNNLGIKALVLDKDNCFAKPYENKIWPEYRDLWWGKLLKEFPPETSLLIVSNSAGTDGDHGYKQCDLLMKETGSVPVLKHSVKKPGCQQDILNYFINEKKICQNPSEIAIVGDRLFTDIFMANMMKSKSVWIRDGVIKSRSPIIKFEKLLYTWLKP